MRITTIEKLASKQLNDAPVVEHIVVTQPVDLIVSGFMLESSPGGWWVWQASWPLYDPRRPPGLTFSERLPLPDDYIHREGLTAADVSNRFVARATRHSALAMARSTPEGYLDHMEMKVAQWPSILESTHVRFRYATTLVVLGRYEEAVEHFPYLTTGGQSSEINGLAQQIFALLEQDGALARDRLLAWVKEIKTSLGLVTCTD